MKKKMMPHIIAVGALAVFIVLGLACATTAGSGKMVLSQYQTPGVPFEDHACVFIDQFIQLVGVDGKMSPLKYLGGENNIILFAPGEHTLNITTFIGGRDEPPYPGHKMTFTVEAGKYYRISRQETIGEIFGPAANFYFMDLDDGPSEYKGDPMPITVAGSPEKRLAYAEKRLKDIRETIDLEIEGYLSSGKK